MNLEQEKFDTQNLTYNTIQCQNYFMRGYSVITCFTISKLDIKKYGW